MSDFARLIAAAHAASAQVTGALSVMRTGAERPGEPAASLAMNIIMERAVTFQPAEGAPHV